MRRQFISPSSSGFGFTTGLEAFRIPGNLSLEEAEIMEDQAAQDAADVERDISEAQRVIEVSDAAQDLANVADSIQEDAPAEMVEVLDGAAAMAVAGSDVPAEEVIPAMEGFIVGGRLQRAGLRVAAESLREKSRLMFERIMKFLKEIWARIESFFYNIFGAIPLIRNKLKKLDAALDSIESKKAPTAKTFELSTGVAGLRVDDRHISTAGELSNGIKGLGELADAVLKDYVGAVSEIGKEIAEQLGKYKAEDSQAIANAIIDSLTKHQTKFKVSGTDDPRFGEDFDTKRAAGVMGGKSLISRTYKPEPDNAHVLGQLDRFRRAGLYFKASNENETKEPAKIDFSIIGVREMRNLISDLRKVLDKVESFNRGGALTKLKTTRQTLENSTKKAAEIQAKAEKDGVESATTDYFRSLANFNLAYANWTREPSIDVVKHIVASSKVVVAVIAKSISQYK